MFIQPKKGSNANTALRNSCISDVQKICQSAFIYFLYVSVLESMDTRLFICQGVEWFWKILAGLALRNQHVLLLGSHLPPGPKSKWLPPTLADWGVNLTNLVGHRRLLLPSPSPLPNHLFGACGWGIRNGELLFILLRFNHLLQRVPCSSSSSWLCGGKWSSTPPYLSACASEPDEMDISLHLLCPSFSLAAHTEYVLLKERKIWLEEYYQS